MKKWLLILALAFALTSVLSTPAVTMASTAGEESFITREEAISYAEYCLEIINGCAVDDSYLQSFIQYYGEAAMWIVYASQDWSTFLGEIGDLTGVKSSTVTTFDSEVIVVELEATGTKRDAVVEFTLYRDKEPEMKMYSVFSLVTLVSKTDLGPNLIIFNFCITLVLAIAVIFLLFRKPSAEQEEEDGVAVAKASGSSRSRATAQAELASDCELVAVIAAAIAAAEGRSSTEGLVVKSIRYKRKAGVHRLA
jgi:hypothetical protein